MGVLDKPLKGVKSEVSLSAFAFLFSEVVQYCQEGDDYIRRLTQLGHGVGKRLLELTAFRASNYKRETKIVNMLSFIQTTVWKHLFGKSATALEKITQQHNAYLIRDADNVLNRFVSPQSVNCAAFAGGIIEGILCSSGFVSRK